MTLKVVATLKLYILQLNSFKISALRVEHKPVSIVQLFDFLAYRSFGSGRSGGPSTISTLTNGK